jgi:hypothetical protein
LHFCIERALGKNSAIAKAGLLDNPLILEQSLSCELIASNFNQFTAPLSTVGYDGNFLGYSDGSCDWPEKQS